MIDQTCVTAGPFFYVFLDFFPNRKLEAAITNKLKNPSTKLITISNSGF
jgi:hypothetical protein